MAITCVVCGREFEPKPTGRRGIVCGDSCRAERGRQMMRDKYRLENGLNAPEKNRPCKECGSPVHSHSAIKKYCSSDCAKKSWVRADTNRKRSGVKIGGEIKCADCGGAAIRKSSGSKRCDLCQSKFNAQKSKRCRERNPDRQRELAAAAAARRRSTDEGAEAYRKQCRLWRSVPKNRLRGRVTAMMNRCLSSGKEGRSWFELVPYSIDDLRDHVERQFIKGMSWDNMGEWHIDHIVPVSAFEFTSPEDEEFKACWALTNLRPMWAKENQRKSAKRLFLI